MNDILSNVIKPLNCNAENMSLEWEAWKNQVEMLCKVRDIKDQEKKKDVLVLLGGLDLQRIYLNLPDLENEESDTNDGPFDTLIKQLDKFFVAKRSKRFERHVFRQMKQLDQEKFDRFVMKLRIQALKCEWSLLQANDNIVDQKKESKIGNERCGFDYSFDKIDNKIIRVKRPHNENCPNVFKIDQKMPEYLQLSLNNFDFHQLLGSGSFGSVFSATIKGTEMRVALKIIKSDPYNSKEFNNELKMLRAVRDSIFL